MCTKCCTLLCLHKYIKFKTLFQFGALTPLEPRLGKKLIEPLTNLIHRLVCGTSVFHCIFYLLCIYKKYFIFPVPLQCRCCMNVSTPWLQVCSQNLQAARLNTHTSLILIILLFHCASVLISLSSGMPNHSASIQVSFIFYPIMCSTINQPFPLQSHLHAFTGVFWYFFFLLFIKISKTMFRRTKQTSWHAPFLIIYVLVTVNNAWKIWHYFSSLFCYFHFVIIYLIDRAVHGDCL